MPPLSVVGNIEHSVSSFFSRYSHWLVFIHSLLEFIFMDICIVRKFPFTLGYQYFCICDCDCEALFIDRPQAMKYVYWSERYLIITFAMANKTHAHEIKLTFFYLSLSSERTEDGNIAMSVFALWKIFLLCSWNMNLF